MTRASRFTQADLARAALIWRARPPSGRFVLHRLPRDLWCPMHGNVTKFHFCKVNRAVTGFKCLPGCSEATCGAPGTGCPA